MVPEDLKAMKPAQRAIRKIKTASLVSSLTKGWQQWASEHSTKQAQEPSGWVPEATEDLQESLKPLKSELKGKPLILSKTKIEDFNGSTNADDGETQIKTKTVTKTFLTKAQEKGMDIGALTERYEKDPSSQIQNTYNVMVDKILQGSVSPTRRRKCSNLVSQLTKEWKQMEKDGEDVSELPSPFEEPICQNGGLEETEQVKMVGNEKLVTGKNKDHSMEQNEDAARIKRSSCSLSNKAVAELHSINKAYKKYSPVNNIKGKWEKWSDQHTLSQKLNPFSDEFDHEFAMSTRLQKGDDGYGRPKDGTKTAERAKRAEEHIHREMRDLCFIIGTMAKPGKDGRVRVTFGELFDRYVRISDKVVGILIRARKHNMLDFPGEMLWQGRDDHVIITLL
ncbi:actin-binding Rho-activating protein [Spea bombifrons]|uniref:actin-binding Rho-activating protein n=1 Tax=Spea bombifrons TaxID=233779 RepID=UPI0023495110|nr:actin-binding Rho-activating protein [Spea bombifrons]